MFVDSLSFFFFFYTCIQCPPVAKRLHICFRYFVQTQTHSLPQEEPFFQCEIWNGAGIWKTGLSGSIWIPSGVFKKKSLVYRNIYLQY